MKTIALLNAGKSSVTTQSKQQGQTQKCEQRCEQTGVCHTL